MLMLQELSEELRHLPMPFQFTEAAIRLSPYIFSNAGEIALMNRLQAQLNELRSLGGDCDRASGFGELGPVKSRY